MEMIQTRITDVFNIRFPVIQGGMIWCAGWELASAVSNSGGLGLIGAGSMRPDILLHHIRKTKKATSFPFGVNVPLIYPNIEDIIEMIIRENVEIVFTSAGNPVKWTSTLKDNGIKVAHVIANSKFAIKCEEAGVDAIVAEGFEAGGHNGREETTTFTLIPQVRRATSLPLIAAGGIGNGEGLLAALALGADGVQIGSRFAASVESSAHTNFKEEIIKAGEGETQLTLKQLIPVRLLKNDFFRKVEKTIEEGTSQKKLIELLGEGRARLGMFEGDLKNGELEIGQISAIIDKILPVSEIIDTLFREFNEAINKLCQF